MLQVLEQLEDKHPLVGVILQWRSLEKLKEECEGMLGQLQPLTSKQARLRGICARCLAWSSLEKQGNILLDKLSAS